MSKILTVFGATGTQGGSVVRAVSTHPQLAKEYKIRAVTRDVAKQAAQVLKKQGIEVVQADLGDKASVVKAISGSNAVFGVTNFWEKASAEVEIAQGKNLADASKEAGVQHLIWSSLPNVIEMSGGKLMDARAFDSKAAVEEYIRTLGLPATFYMSGLHMSSIRASTRKTPDRYTIAWPLTPTTAVPIIDAEVDTGNFVAAILSHPGAMLGKRISGANGWITAEQIAATIEEVSGVKTTFREISDEVFRGFFPPAMASIRGAALVNLREYSYFGPDAHADVAESLKILGQKPTSFTEYVEKNLPWVA
ncbi:hypothetical protein MMC13_006778 [Lambiella insularis]|nr:hypothetical protein [Lambiella insularis]